MTNWQRLTIYEQLANVGSEFNRLLLWRQKKRADLTATAAKRALDLVDQTMADPKNYQYRRELQRLKQLISEFAKINVVATDTKPETLTSFFLAYGLAVRS